MVGAGCMQILQPMAISFSPTIHRMFKHKLKLTIHPPLDILAVFTM